VEGGRHKSANVWIVWIWANYCTWSLYATHPDPLGEAGFLITVTVLRTYFHGPPLLRLKSMYAPPVLDDSTL
jgi:hypothetical protein